MKIVPGINRVIVKPLDDSLLKSHTQIQERRFIDEHFQKNPWGRVVSAPKDLYFYPGQKEDAVGNEDLVQMSVPWWTDVEVQEGDLVLFDYLATIDEDNWFEIPGIGLCYSIRYEQLIAKKLRGRPSPLNGYFFLRVESDEVEVAGMKVEQEKVPEMTQGLIVEQGTPNMQYLLARDIDLYYQEMRGRKVGYKKNKAWRIEIEEYQQEASGSDWALYAIHQKDVFLTI